MNKIPIPVLSLILTIVGPFPEIYSLKLVCKNWRKVIESSYHLVTFQRSANKRLQPGNFNRLIRDTLLEKFSYHSPMKPLNLLSLDLRSVDIDEKALSSVIIDQPWLLKLNLINNKIDLESLWKYIHDYATNLAKHQGHFKHSLEDLRISNHSFHPNIGYQYIPLIFTNLKKLYAGNTNTSLSEFKFILKTFKALEILDLSYCSELQIISNLEELDIEISGERKSLKIIFLTKPSVVLEEILLNLSVKVIKSNIDEILNEIEEERDLEKLNEWLSIGGEVNTASKSESRHTFYPQIELMKKPIPEDILIKAYKLMVKYDLDIYTHDDDQQKLNQEISCNFICSAALHSKIHLFNYFIEHSFPVIKCKNHPNFLLSSDVFDDLIINPQILDSIKIPLEILYEAAQYHTWKRNENLASAIIDFFLPLNLDEKVVLSKMEDSILLGNHSHKPLIALAAENSCKTVLKKLITNNFDINLQDNFGRTALISSSEWGNANILSFLWENGADVNKRDNLGRTALHLAAQNGHISVVRELLSLGSELSPVCKRGKTPLDLAAINKRVFVSNLLKQVGAKRSKSIKKRCEVY